MLTARAVLLIIALAPAVSLQDSRPASMPAGTRPASLPVIVTIGRDVDGDSRADYALPGTVQENNEKGGQTISIYSGASHAEIRNIKVFDSATVQNVIRDEILVTRDHNGDGLPDLLLYPWSERGQILLWAGGKDGAPILQLYTPAKIPSQRPAQIAVADLDADGIDDVLLTTPDGAAALSGKTGDGMFVTKRGGIHLCICGDLNLDGVVDFAAGGDAAMRSKSIFVYSGADGTEIFKIDGAAPPGPVPGAITSPGDLNRDGIVDFTIGSSRESSMDYRAGVIRNYSGATGGCLRLTRHESVFSARLGEQLVTTSDVDGDGICDIFVGAPRADGPARASAAGMVCLYSPNYGTFLWKRFGPVANAQIGEYLRAIGDVNGDGVADVITGASWPNDKKTGFLIISGKNGEILKKIEK